MELLDLIALLRRHTLIIATIVIAAVIASLTVWQMTPVHGTATLLYAVSISKTETTNAYDLTKVADDFAQTVTGWMKSPTFGTRVSEIAGGAVDIAGEGQAKQNFLVHLTHDAGMENQRAIDATIEVLKKRIDAYNAQSRYTFAITPEGQSTGTDTKNPIAIAIAAAIGGFVLAAMWILAIAYAGGRVTSVREAEELLGVAAAVTFCGVKSADTSFLAAIAKNKKHAVFVGVDTEIAPLLKAFDLKADHLTLPANATKLSGSGDLIAIVRLDTTRRATLRMLRAMHADHLTLAVWG